MDFFGSQDQARRRSRLLLAYYFIAVAIIVLATHAAVVGILSLPAFFADPPDPQAFRKFKEMLFTPRIFGLIGAITLVIIFVGTLLKLFALRGGGHAIALAMGGEPVLPDTKDPYEKRALNITEEMAIAAGVPVPTLYILKEEEGINAFAAGYSFQDAVVGITKGCAQKLSRDELQGVIAHEFSHIFNADMKLNLRLIGILNGILFIYILGRIILRILSQASARSNRNSRGGGGGALLLAAMLGISLAIIGSVGAFMARIIQSAISRQREYLADASAVQYTRNPGGIAGALKKIGGFYTGSNITSGRAVEASHMFFAEGVKGLFAMLFSTHPPLSDRISRIEPGFAGQFIEDASDKPFDLSNDLISELAPLKQISESIEVEPDSFVESLGNLNREALERAQQIVWSLPESLKEATHSKLGAQAIPFILLLSSKESVARAELEKLGNQITDDLKLRVIELLPQASLLRVGQRLPLLDLAIPYLKQLSRDEYAQFNSGLSHMLTLDSGLSLFEFVLVSVLHHSVEKTIYGLSAVEGKRARLSELLPDIAVVISALAHAGHDADSSAHEAFISGLGEFSGTNSANFQSRQKCHPQDVCKSLNNLAQATSSLKRQIVRAAVRAICTDGKITPVEAEMLRACCENLDCPMPAF